VVVSDPKGGPARIAWFLGLMACSAGNVPVAVAPPPALARADELRFVAIGDAGKGNDVQARVAAGVARACGALGCDFLVLLGDNLYPSGPDSASDPRLDERIADPYAGIGVPLYLVLGNHDYGNGLQRERADAEIAWAAGRDGVELPANLWVSDVGPARIVGLDTNAALQFGSGFQRRWLQEQLAGSGARWNVVLGHHPYRSDGPHGNAGEYEGLPFVPWLSGTALRRLFDAGLCGGADLYLAGHDHTRQLLDACGVTLVVSGTGASGTRIVDRGNHPRFATAAPGAVWLSLGPDEGRVVFLDADGASEGEFAITPRRRAASN
jgi:hypothetical protein